MVECPESIYQKDVPAMAVEEKAGEIIDAKLMPKKSEQAILYLQ